MIQSQERIKQVLTTLAGKESAVDVRFDVSFSRRPRSGFEIAQQSYGVAVRKQHTETVPVLNNTPELCTASQTHNKWRQNTSSYFFLIIAVCMGRETS
jgi:hypothetical protein